MDGKRAPSPLGGRCRQGCAGGPGPGPAGSAWRGVAGFLVVGLWLAAACGVPRTVTVAELAEAAKAGDGGAARELVGRMGSPWPEETRSEAYRAVLSLPDGVLEGAVRKACRSGDPVLREHALAVAGNRKWPWAYAEALRALEDGTFPRRYVGAWVLGELGKPEAAPALIRALGSGGETAKEAARALVRLGRAVVPAVLEALETAPDRARGYLVRVLGDLRDPAAVPALVRALEDPAVRADAAWALGRAGVPAAAGALRPFLDDPDWRVRVETVRALGVLEDQGAVAAVDRLRTDDPVPAVREWAARSLAILTGTPVTYPDARGRWVLPDALYR